MLDFPYQASTGIPYVALLVEALRWIAWPIAAMVVAQVLREPISNAVNKLTGLSYGNVKAEFNTQPSKAESLDRPLASISEPGEIAPNHLIEANLTEAHRYVRDFVKQELEAFPEDQKMDVLIMSVAMERLQKHFALAYVNIFGSQIRALEHLNQNNRSIGIDEASLRFSELQSSQEELKDWTLERYLRYLRNFQMIEIGEREIKLTPIGRDFVVWLGATGMNKDKPL